MSTRRKAREFAVQILFQEDMNRQDEISSLLKSFWEDKEASDEARLFAEELVTGTIENLSDIDDTIKRYSEHWDIKRMGVLDRNVIRLGVYELLYRDDIPSNVSINEAVDIAKYFSDELSGKFINGILDKINRESPR